MIAWYLQATGKGWGDMRRFVDGKWKTSLLPTNDQLLFFQAPVLKIVWYIFSMTFPIEKNFTNKHIKSNPPLCKQPADKIIYESRGKYFMHLEFISSIFGLSLDRWILSCWFDVSSPQRQCNMSNKTKLINYKSHRRRLIEMVKYWQMTKSSQDHCMNLNN